MNRRAASTTPLAKVVTLEGEEYLHFLPLPIDVAIVRGTASDANGNVEMVIDAGLIRDTYFALCQAEGHDRPNVIGA